MEFRVLGPVEIHAAGETIPLGPQQRLVLAVLLAEAGRLIPTELLIDRAWETAEHGTRRTLHVHITRLRRLLARPGDAGGPSVPLVHLSGGYRLDVEPARVDLHRFRRLVANAREADRPDPQKAARLREAIGLWRGEPLAGLAGQWAARTRAAWQQEYLDAVVLWARSEVCLGNPAAVTRPLTKLSAQHPLVEPLASELMRALHQLGRTADALEAYGRVRRSLADELGLDPGPELQQLHQAILRGDAAPAHTGARQPEPRELPVPPQIFTGRAREVAALEALHEASTVVISAIDGMAGIGKTALVVHAAHRIADRYPDGQLFVDLHGYTPGVAPVDPGAALDRVLRTLGVPAPQIPAGLDERAAMYRTRLADRQMLIVLDNAAAETQVRPLLPGAPGCLVLVTSRRRLPGLDSTHALTLDTLPVPDAVVLFTRSAGPERLAGEPYALLVELVELCGRLPLAIRIAAARMRSHPSWPMSHLVERLRDQRHRLRELDAGQRSVTAALDLSYRDLDSDQQKYCMLGLHPGLDFDAYAAAALLDGTPQHTNRALDRLLDAHLIQEPAPGRYRFHDLTRAHAAHTAIHDQSEPVRHAAMNRLLDYYQQTATVAVDTAYPYERTPRPETPPASAPRPELATPASALTWLDAELTNLLAAVGCATQCRRPDYVQRLSALLHRHLRNRGRYQDAEILHQQALALARVTGDRPAEAEALNGLGHIHRLQDQYTTSADHYQQAWRIARAVGHPAGELDALVGLGHIRLRQADYAGSADHYRRALEIAGAAGRPAGELEARLGLGNFHRLRGAPERAAEHFELAVRLARSTGHQSGELRALYGLGSVQRLLGRPATAAEHYREALRIARSTGHSYGELIVLTGLGKLHREQGRHEQAADHYQRLLRLAREIGSRNYEFEAYQGLGQQQHAAGDPRAAIGHHRRALALARELTQPVDQARAHDGLARAYDALEQHERAREHWQHALRILTDLGLDHTDEQETSVTTIRARLVKARSRRRTGGAARPLPSRSAPP
jgi:DNA-binding SARP family transcriptional activator/tetratricopeptide (TPR) repeat protein